MYSARLQECKSPCISLNKQRKCETSEHRNRCSTHHFNLHVSTHTLHWEQLFLFSWQLRQPATIWGLTVLQDSSTLGLMSSFYHRGKWRENPVDGGRKKCLEGNLLARILYRKALLHRQRFLEMSFLLKLESAIMPPNKNWDTFQLPPQFGKRSSITMVIHLRHTKKNLPHPILPVRQ